MDHVFTLIFPILLSVSASSVTGSAPPEIQLHPIDIQVIRNEPVTLDCRVSGSPEPSVEWFKLDFEDDSDNRMGAKPVTTTATDPSSHRLLLPDGSLFFLTAKQGKREHDAGVYWCVAANKHGVVRSKNATLRIAYMRDDFRETPEDMDVTLGAELIIPCSPPLAYPPPVVTWKKDGENIAVTSSSRIQIAKSGSLVVKNVKLTDRGRYQCQAENIAAKKTSKPLRVRVNEMPFFVTKPESQSVMSGSSVLISCQAAGEPHPDIEWYKASGEPLKKNRVIVVHGKGIRIDKVTVDDEGVYVCKAKNLAGEIKVNATLKVSEKPTFVMRPNSVIQASSSVQNQISLDCLADGNPKPILFWSTEGSPKYLFPGDSEDNLRVLNNGTLIIKDIRPSNSGHFFCTIVNEAGSDVARSQVLITDNSEDNYLENDRGAIFREASDLTEARIRFDDLKIDLESVIAIGPKAVKLTWTVSDQGGFVSGFRVWYRESHSSDFQFMEIAHPQVTSFVLNHLEEFTSYDMFVQPFYREVSGICSKMASVETHQTVPQSAPVITDARIVNESTIDMKWNTLHQRDINGPLKGYEILIQGNGTSFNRTVDPDVTSVTLRVHGMAANRLYTIQIAAFNPQGRGPFSAPLQLELETESDSTDEPDVKKISEAKLTWILITAAILFFGIAMLLMAFALYRRACAEHGMIKMRSRTHLGYLETSTDEFHHHHCHLAKQSQQCIPQPHHQSLWIDHQQQQQKHQEEEESSSSEKKLLAHSNSNSDSEYTYVETNKPQQPFSQYPRCSKNNLSAYASTEIFRCATKSSNNYLTPTPRKPPNHYSAPIFHQPGYKSCNDLSRSNSNSRRANVPHNGSRRSRNMKGTNPNLLDILPPPPVYPPPPPMRESLISPSYLLNHPVYHQTRHQVQGGHVFDRALENELQNFNQVATSLNSSKRQSVASSDLDNNNLNHNHNCEADHEDNASSVE